MTDSTTAAAHVGRDWAAFIELLDGDVWDHPTRLAGWTVEDLARHVHWGMTLEAEALELAAAAAAGGEDGRARGVHLKGPREDVVAALRVARERLLTALGGVPGDPVTCVPMPYGDVPVGLAMDVFVMEAAVHRSDLAHAVGTDDRLDPGTHASVAHVLQSFWPSLATAASAIPPPRTGVELRGTSVRVAAEFDGRVWESLTREPAVVIEGDDEAVLLAGYGRLPVTSSRLQIHGDRALAERFKEFVPGP